jgi:hypothetical protein
VLQKELLLGGRRFIEGEIGYLFIPLKGEGYYGTILGPKGSEHQKREAK